MQQLRKAGLESKQDYAQLQAALLAKDALRREVMAMQSSLHDVDSAKQAQQHIDSVSSNRQHSRRVTTLTAMP